MRTSAIVPVFNEELTVAAVVDTLLACGLVDEVVCVNDGSTDGSLAVLRRFGAQIVLIDLPSNRGKGHALAEGIRQATGNCVAFFDADLTNLSSTHVAALVTPIWMSAARVVLGSPGSDTIYCVARAIAPGMARSAGSTFTGERAYLRQDLLPDLSRMETTRFGVEVYLNVAFCESATAVVHLPGLKALSKQRKHGWRQGITEYGGEVLEVSREVVRTSLARFAA